MGNNPLIVGSLPQLTQHGPLLDARRKPATPRQASLRALEPSLIGSLFSCDLVEIEATIRKAVQTAVRSRTTVCLALARIKTGELYRQVGCSSFKEYLRERRVGLPYHTAHEYARIGEILHAYRDELSAMRFDEETGLKKLLLLERALRRNGHDRSSVFGKLGSCSYRQFREYACAQRSARADCPVAPFVEEAPSGIQLDGTGECIVMKSLGKEIIWFDTDLERCFPTPAQARSFKMHILDAVKGFFDQSRTDDRPRFDDRPERADLTVDRTGPATPHP